MFGAAGFGEVAAGQFQPFISQALAAVAAFTVSTTPVLVGGTGAIPPGFGAIFGGAAFGVAAPGEIRGSISVDLNAHAIVSVRVSVARLSGATSVRAYSTFHLATSGAVSDARIQAAAAVVFRSTRATLTEPAAQFQALARAGFRTLAGPLASSGFGFSSAAVTFNGVPATTWRRGSWTITDLLNEQVNTADFIVDGAPPAIGTDVKIGLGNTAPANLLFAGTVQRVDKGYELKPAHPSWAIHCGDYTFLLNRRLVFGTYTNVSATTIAQGIVSTYGQGFNSSGIAAGLPAVTVTFPGVPVMQALVQLANLIGGYTYVDYSKGVHLFVTETTTPPDPLTPTNPNLQMLSPVTLQTDESQVRTRVIVRGKTATVAGPPAALDGSGNPLPTIPAGAAQIPVSDATIFSIAGGQALTNDQQLLTYTTVHTGGIGNVLSGTLSLDSTTATLPAPTTGPGAAVASGVIGGLKGTYSYALAFANASQQSAQGPPNSGLSVPAFAAPGGSVSPFAVSTIPVGPLIGTYNYRVTFVTAAGETTPGPVSTITTSAVQPPPLFASVGASGSSGARLPGAGYRYAVSFVTQYGETLPSSQQAGTIPALPVPGVTSWTGFAAGGLYGGNYSYGISLITRYGESAVLSSQSVGSGLQTNPPGAAPTWNGSQDTAGRIQPGLTYYWAASFFSDRYGETPLGPAYSNPVGGALPIRMGISPNNSVPAGMNGIRIYRAISGYPYLLNQEFRVENGIPGAYWDALAQGEQGGQYPVQSLHCGQRLQVGLGSGGFSDITARRLYRNKAAGSEWFLVGEIPNNSNGATYMDETFDADLSTRPPSASPLGYAMTITGIYTGIPSGQSGVIARRIYRTKANGSQLFLVAELNDTSTTAWTDTVPDSALTKAAPALATAGGQALQLQYIPIGPGGTLARRIYRTVAGGSDYHLLIELQDNGTTTWTDAVADASLVNGAGPPLVSTAGGGAINLSGIPAGPAGTTMRVIYRTKAGDSSTFLYCGSINDNVTSTYLDTLPDASLGQLPQSLSTSSATLNQPRGALAGDTAIYLDGISGIPNGGWLNAGSQTIRFTGVHGTGPGFSGFVDGIPTSGPGSVTGKIAAGTTLTTVPMLMGVSGIVRGLVPGQSVQLYVVRDSPSGQSQLAAAEGGDGIHEAPVTDTTLASVAACAARGDAELALFQYVRAELRYKTRDIKTSSGDTVVVNLPAPTSITGSFLIQKVVITQIDIAPRTMPLLDVTASNTKFSLEDLLRHVVLA